MQNFIQGIRNLIKWFPIIWKDRDSDYTFIMEIMKKKLMFSAEAMRKYSLHTNAQRSAQQMEQCAILLDIVQNEIFQECLINKEDLKQNDVENAIAAHNRARVDAFEMLSEHIESWWF